VEVRVRATALRGPPAFPLWPVGPPRLSAAHTPLSCHSGSLRQASSEQAAAAVSWAVLREAAVVVADADFGVVGVVVGVVGVVVVEVVGVGVEESSVGLSSALERCSSEASPCQDQRLCSRASRMTVTLKLEAVSV